MKRKYLGKGVFLASLALVGLSAGCAQNVGDIDRTKPNKIKKSDLAGSWYMQQKVVELSPTVDAGFFAAGVYSHLDKVVFGIEEKYLIAYSTYPKVPGADLATMDSYESLYNGEYKGGAVAIYPIKEHFDVQREYDSSTGEQKNVIVEDSRDRHWNERAYMRVDWSKNSITNFDMPTADLAMSVIAYEKTEGSGDPNDTLYLERNEKGELIYFDAPSYYNIESDWYSCALSMYGYYQMTECGAGEAKIVTAFAKDTRSSDYEPLIYTDPMMNRFGLFRIERGAWDRRTGQIMKTGRLQLAQRVNLWKESYKHDANGKLITKDGKDYGDAFVPYEQRIPIPLSERKVKTRPFYIYGLNVNESEQPTDPAMDRSAVRTILAWNKQLKKSIARTRGIAVDNVENVDEILKQIPDVVVPCHVPVIAEDLKYVDEQGKAICGSDTPLRDEKGRAVIRPADPRKHILFYVTKDQRASLLGLAGMPSDPLTGEILGVQPNVYVGALNNYANVAVERLQYYLGFKSDSVNEYESHLSETIANSVQLAHSAGNLEQLVDVSRVSDSLKNIKVDDLANRKQALEMRRQMRDVRANVKKFDLVASDARYRKAVDAGLYSRSDSNIVYESIAKRMGMSVDKLTPEQIKFLSPYVMFGTEKVRQREAVLNYANSRGMCFTDMLAEASVSDLYSNLMERYKNAGKAGGPTWDDVWQDIRESTMLSTALHEAGHSFGLRHNFGASFDALNFYDKFYEALDKNKIPSLKVENGSFTDPRDAKAVYSVYALDAKEKEAGLRTLEASSVMDYTIGPSMDREELGKYDDAAITFSYSAGSDYVNLPEDQCVAAGGMMQDSKCVAHKAGLIEVFAKKSDELNIAGKYLTHADTARTSTFDDQLAAGQPLLEYVHYTTLFGLFPEGIKDVRQNRKWISLNDYLSEKKNTEAEYFKKIGKGEAATLSRAVRVPYIFCTDDNANMFASCRRFDAGADTFHQVLNAINIYRLDYPFLNFSRGRMEWHLGSAIGSNMRLFQTIGTVYQTTLLKPEMSDIKDNFLKAVNEASMYSSLNFFAEVLATPQHGKFCRTPEGSLFPISDDTSGNPDSDDKYTIFNNCKLNDKFQAEYVIVPRGQGRTRFSRYDKENGFDYSNYLFEAPHMYISYIANRVMMNPAVRTLYEGDVGSFSLSFYSLFSNQIQNLYNNLINERYHAISPEFKETGEKIPVRGADGRIEEMSAGYLKYKPLVTINYEGKEINPETGEEYINTIGAHADVQLFGLCQTTDDCMGSASYKSLEEGRIRCMSLFPDQDAKRCILITGDQKEKDCPFGGIRQVIQISTNKSITIYICAPDSTVSVDSMRRIYDNIDKAHACDIEHLYGICPTGQKCTTDIVENSIKFKGCQSTSETAVVGLGGRCTENSQCIAINSVLSDKSECKDNRCVITTTNTNMSLCDSYMAYNGKRYCVNNLSYTEKLEYSANKLQSESEAGTYACGPGQVTGVCDDVNKYCHRGNCVTRDPVVITDTSLNQTTDYIITGLLDSVIAYSTRFNERLVPFKVGSGENRPPNEDFKLISYTDPETGLTYGAHQRTCDSDRASCSLYDPARINEGMILNAIKNRNGIDRAWDNFEKVVLDIAEKENINPNDVDFDCDNDTGENAMRYCRALYNFFKARNQTRHSERVINLTRGVYNIIGSAINGEP